MPSGAAIWGASALERARAVHADPAPWAPPDPGRVPDRLCGWSRGDVTRILRARGTHSSGSPEEAVVVAWATWRRHVTACEAEAASRLAVLGGLAVELGVAIRDGADAAHLRALEAVVALVARHGKPAASTIPPRDAEVTAWATHHTRRYDLLPRAWREPDAWHDDPPPAPSAPPDIRSPYADD